MSDLQAENKGCWDRVHDLEAENGKYFEQIGNLQAENERLKKRELELESIIGGVCPEDVSLVEFVESLKKKIVSCRKAIDDLVKVAELALNDGADQYKYSLSNPVRANLIAEIVAGRRFWNEEKRAAVNENFKK